MIEDVEGKPQPEVGVGDHWEMFRQVRLEDRLFPPLADAITRAVEDAVRQSVSATIDSRRLGAVGLSPGLTQTVKRLVTVRW
jgi:hypothetical protein